jgi:hypothetical protein
MSKNINTVGDLVAELSKYPEDLVLETYKEDGLPRAVTLMHLVPDAEEVAGGSYEVLLFCGDTIPTHKMFKKNKD